MQPRTRPWLVAGILLLASFVHPAQAQQDHAKDQGDFALAVAKAHARTNLFGAGALPVSIRAKAVSSLALHGTGTGTYENRWVDAQHWQRILKFPDFKQSEMRNDSGQYWVERSTDSIPIRMAQLLQYVAIQVPNSTRAAAYVVSESAATGEDGEALACYAATQPAHADGFPRKYRWCFETGSGLLVSEDMPLNLHLAYSNYIAFQGKQEFTHVRMTAGSLAALDVDILYAPLDPHALDALVPTPTMQRGASAMAAANPEEWGKDAVEYRYSPALPGGTPDAVKDKAAHVYFQVSADNRVLDACLEDAPTMAMAEAALQAAKKFTFTPLTLDGKPVGSRFYSSIWFQSNAVAGSKPGQAGTFRDDDLSFTFRYPAEFEAIPRGQLEEEHKRDGDKQPSCNTMLFRAQHLHPGNRTPEVVSLVDMDPACTFGLLDRKAFESIPVNAAHSIVDRWSDGVVSKPKRYKLNDRTFVVVSASGIPHSPVAETLNVMVVVTTIREHVVGWTLLGPDDNLAQTLAACSLQVGTEGETPLIPTSEKP